MAVESASYVNQLNANYPQDVDLKLEGAAHIRLEKQVLLSSFPNVGGPVSATHTALSGVGVTQSQADNSTNPASTAYVQNALLTASLSGQLPARAGNAGKFLAVTGDEVGVEWKASSPPVGTIATVAKTAPTDGTWLACDGSVYLQASYADLYAELGLLANNPSAIGVWVNNAGITAAQSSVCWSGTEFISCGGSVIYRLGADGSGSTTATHGGTNLSACASDGSGLVIATAISGTGTIRSTDGGGSWAAGGTLASGAGRYSDWGNGQFVVVGNNLSATTPDGVTYTARVFTGNPTAVKNVAGADWIASVAAGNVVRSADNAVSWGSTIATGLTYISGLCVVNGLIVAVGDISSLPAIAASKDGGLTWRIVFFGAAGTANSLAGIAFGAGVWMVHTNTASQGLLMSFDAYNWQYSASAAAIGRSLMAIAYAQGRFVSVTNITSNGAQRTPMQCLAYNTATQFAVPQPVGQLGVKQFIKAA